MAVQAKHRDMGRTTTARLRRRARRALAGALVATSLGLLSAPGTAQAAPPDAPVAADPLVAGPFEVTVAEYQGGPTVVTDRDTNVTYPAEIHGVAHYPTPAEGAEGPFPLVVYIHGNHGTCAVFGSELPGYPCPYVEEDVLRPVPNHRGYDYLGQNLASHGYVTVSIDANAVNTFNVTGDRGAQERSQLIARTLDLVAGLNDGTAIDLGGEIGDDLLGRVDFDRLGMMGHSRGGEAVTDFLSVYNPTRTDGPRYDVDAVLSLAGVEYSLQPTTGAHFASIAPLCDGDVFDLQSIFGNDRHRFDETSDPYARHIFTIAGTNHGHYNSEWIADDFRGSGTCDPANEATQRLIRADVERMSTAFVNGFMRRYVGGELAFDSLLDGSARIPAAACPGGVGPCDDIVGISFLAPAEDRLLVATPGPDAGSPFLADGADPLATNDLGGAVTATGFDRFELCDPQPDDGMDGKTRDPGTASTCVTNPYRSRADAFTLEWTSPARLDLALSADGSALDATGFDALTFRTAANFDAAGAEDELNPGDGATDLQVAVTDATGATATVTVSERSSALVPQVPDPNRELTMNGVVVPLAELRAAGVDTTALTAISFLAGDVAAGQPATGSVQLAEVAFQRLADDQAPPPVVPEGRVALAALALLAAGAVLVVRRRPAAST